MNKVFKWIKPSLKTVLSIGGWTLSDKFSQLAASPTARAQFAASVKTFINTYGFDGVDIDWEFPVEGE